MENKDYKRNAATKIALSVINVNLEPQVKDMLDDYLNKKDSEYFSVDEFIKFFTYDYIDVYFVSDRKNEYYFQISPRKSGYNLHHQVYKTLFTKTSIMEYLDKIFLIKK